MTKLTMQEELARIWREEGVTLILVTHDLEEAIYLADRIVALGGKPGELRAERIVPEARPRARDTQAARDLAQEVRADITGDRPATADWVI